MQAFDWIASIALGISLLSLAVALNQHLRDRYKLRFTAFILTRTGDNGETYQIGVKATNDGRRPVSVADIYFEWVLDDDGQRLRYQIRTSIHGGRPDEVHPVELMESQTRQFMSEEYSQQKMIQLSSVIDVYVRDSRGKTYHLPVDNDAYYSLLTDDPDVQQ